MKIKITKGCSIAKCKGESKYCSYCEGRIGKNNYGFSLKNPNTNGYNCWLHFECLKPFAKLLEKVFKKNQSRIVGELLSEK